MMNLAEVRKNVGYHFTRPLVQFLARTRVTPNALTWFGFLLSIVATALIVTEQLLAAGIMVLVAGFFDMLDGALARHTNQATRFGGILDATLDRLAESLLLLGTLVLFAREPSFIGIVLAGVALPSSLMVSYTRARGEALGLNCKAGVFTRPERVIILALGLLLSNIEYALIVALGIIVLFSIFTVCQRLINIRSQLKNA